MSEDTALIPEGGQGVVGMGEIGLDNGNKHELKLLIKIQLAIAREHNMPVIVHIPTPS